MTVCFHPADEVLLAYGAGSLDEATALLVATHLALCPRCRAEIARIESVGGALLEQLPPDTLADGALDAVLARLDDPPLPPPRPASVWSGPHWLPPPLRDYVGPPAGGIRWKRLGRGLEQALVVQGGHARARLYRIAAGVAIPEHGHDGSEMTLVLHGGFQDHNGHYLPGDVASADAQTVHVPVADRDGECICLAVTDAPLRLSGLVGRLISPFLNL